MHNSLQFVDDINRQLIRFGDKTIGEIALDLDINLMAGKGASSNVLRKIIHKITMDRPFGGIDKRQSLKIIPVDSNTTKCFESLSFRAIEIKQVLNSDFVNSSVMDEIQKQVYLPIYKKERREHDHKCHLGKAFRLVFDGDLYRTINEDFMLYQSFFQNLERVYSVDGFDRMKTYWVNNFPRTPETTILHMRPHARNKIDFDTSMEGYQITKHSFWLNRDFINALLKSMK